MTTFEPDSSGVAAPTAVQTDTELEGFRGLVRSYRAYIAQVDVNNTALDARIKEFEDAIADMKREKADNLTTRESKVLRLNGVLQLLRDLEDRDLERKRDKEDADITRARRVEDAL